jgi:hypothetical protein
MSFDHRDHLRLAWEAVARGGLAGALAEVPAALRALAAGAGRPEKYHETVTVGFVLLVAERWADQEDFDAFLARNPDLDRDALARWWRPETLASARARERFVMPDRPISG